ncbi:uncharacterized protein SPPG_06992 [Spizellomyces punctatus DAOM BR117]|uniref:COP9 signalosome complex subunit 3 n=1 Tax=Spizellomyces punctatus (strain DAOM BR117) TaxID=645134 RepID=A0A0L0H939_SPIPD|nr:uncharacterized protein SPPG_06992 [Spizellomyces punctatus DAOM BR117]KNC97516.1 hypothetical protein SPPG_06992 [Spizellomyces punctatus DAOM BR117]|eukprot:XP_016605556.1 hypothetical protein SPPG_06992 [Spizellomyces punctatus DAOM BR117]
MDDLLRQIKAVERAGVEKPWADLLPVLKAASSAVLCSCTVDGQDPLDLLNPKDHSLAYLFILVARMKATNADGGVLLQAAMRFAEQFERDQVLLAPEQMTAYGEATARLADKIDRPISSVRPIQIACIRWSGSKGNHLTSLHRMVLKCCLLAKTYRAALPVLDRDITEIDPQSYDLKYQDFLLHYYYGGMIYVGLKRFERALQCFHLCLTAPGFVASAIQVEAHRKYILVSLILHGRSEPLPKYTNSAVFRACKQYGAAYLDFAHAYESLNFTRIETEFRKSEQQFEIHGNRGLVMQSMTALVRRNIQQLTQTYLTLSLSDIAKSVKLSGAAEAERIVLQMIEDGEVFATINQCSGGMVSFRDAPETYKAIETMRRLKGEVTQAIDLGERVIRMDRALGLSKDFLSKILHGERGQGANIGTADDDMFGDDSIGEYWAGNRGGA